ncbi:MAG: DUF1552 domain-containing protein [Myxococcales bacterium]|nr:DUF1552 domain-containing protein [Myxococcales bacterium]
MGVGRRRFLKSLGGAAGAAALVEPLVRVQRARAADIPKRLIVFFSPLGHVTSEWLPKGTETNFTFGRILSPLDAFKSRMIVCGGLKQPRESYTGNHKEMTGLLSGREANGKDDSSSPSHISIDQFLAQDPKITGGTAFPSISLAAWQSRYYDFQKRTDHMYLSARGPGQAVIPEGLPQAAFDRIFGGFTAPGGDDTEPMVDPKLARRRSVLDVIKADLDSVQRSIGATSPEKAKIEQHLTSIRELEKRLVQTPFTGSGDCRVPNRPGEFSINDDKTIPERFKLHIDIAVAALACDRTRIAVLTGEGGESFAKHPWLGINEQYHEHTHGGGIEEQIKIGRWYAEQFNYLLESLDSIPEGGGSLLDNTCVLWLSEQGCRDQGQEHMRTNMPYLLAGECGGYFKTGRFVDMKGASTTRMLINIKNAMGSSGNSFGDVTETPLPGLT